MEGASSSYSNGSSTITEWEVTTFRDLFSYAVSTSFQFLNPKGSSIPEDFYTSLGDFYTHFSHYCDATLTYEDAPVNAYRLSYEEGTFSIDKDFYDFLLFAEEMKSLTDGYINILSGNLNWLWKESFPKKENTVFERPTSYEISSKIEEMNESSLSLEQVGSTYQVNKKGTAMLDFGAMAKGYAVSKIVEKLKEHNEKYYILNAGSSSIALGENPRSEDGTFSIGISDIQGASFHVKNCAIGTSSTSNQHYFDEKTNTLYSHVINPKTGSAVPSATTVIVLGDDAGLCDVLSTYTLMLGEEIDFSFFEEKGYRFLVYDYRESSPYLYQSEDFPLELA